MKTFIKILVVLVAVTSVAFVVAMFSKNKYTLVREIVINRPIGEVFAYIKLLKNQQAYSKWLSLDPATKIGYKGAPYGMPGYIMTFNSKSRKAGIGEWENVQIVENEMVTFNLRFLKPFPFVANGHMAVKAEASAQTRLTWEYNSGMKWPANFMLLFMDIYNIICWYI